jgi:Putative prokaryotic signal transducing protein
MHDTALMKRLTTAPNLALATLWADLLSHAGVPTTVQRQYASSIAGEVPPDQTLPELWVQDADQFERAGTLLKELRNPPHRHWACPGCAELIDGPFEQCWNCGAAMPA